MPTTLKDIAEAAGVSIGTVDRALKNRGRINPEVAEKIKKIAKEMNYQTNKIASGLANKSRKYKIAVILHVTGNDYFDEILKGIKKAEKEIRDYGMSVQIYPCEDFNQNAQLINIEKSIENGANGIIIVPINAPIIRKKIRQLQNENFPIVFLNSYLNRIPVFSSIHCDYFRTGRIGAKLIDLISEGKGDVIAFFPSSNMLGNNQRKEGCEHYFKNKKNSSTLLKTVELSNNSDINYEIMLKELNNYENVNYILFCGDSDVALNVLKSINRPIRAVFYDFGPETKKALKNGIIDAAITQSPKYQGYKSVFVLFEYFTSDIIPEKEILIDSQIVFTESID